MAEQPSAPPGDAQPEPGAPIPAGAVDEELLHLRAPGLRRHPLVVAAVLLLGALMLYQLHNDVAYSLRPGVPEDLGEARGVRGGPLSPGRYVTLSGLPDYRNALGFDARGERRRSYLFRLLGTGNRVLVITRGPSAAGDYRNRFTGRLRRFDDLPYAATVRDYYHREARVLRALDLGKLRELGAAGAFHPPLQVPDRSGEALGLQPAQELLIDVLFPDDLRVLLPKDKFPTEADARHEVERLGLPAGPGIETQDGYGYVLRLPPSGAQRNQAIARVDGQGWLLLHRVEVYRVPASVLQVTSVGLSLPGPEIQGQPTRYVVDAKDPRALVPALQPGQPTLLPWSDVQAVQISEPLVIPDGAVVLLDGEAPAGVRWTLPLCAVLLLFIGFNLWYLWRSYQEKRSQ